MPLTERDVNIPPNIKTHTPTVQKNSQGYSKLPRRVPTSSSSSSTPPWSARATDRSAFADKAATQAESPLHYKRHSVTANTKPKTTLPLVDKPLPSRPIARVSNLLSPTKDSRGLIDAIEKPLQITDTAGDKHEWPALTPQSSRSASMTPSSNSRYAQEDVETMPASTYATPLSVMAAATELTNVITGKHSTKYTDNERISHSPASSYASATESSSLVSISRKHSIGPEESLGRTRTATQQEQQPNSCAADAEYPTRKASLRSRISSGSLVSPAAGSKHHFIGFTDFTRIQAASPASTESRTHSPSPASFSRPRPGSVSSMSAGSKTTRTASRIPIPDSKKATMVDVKREQYSESPLARTSGTPTFGSRRLASPDALKILENGKMRRQMQHTVTHETLAGLHCGRAATTNSDAITADTPSLSHSLTSSPEASSAPTSSENQPHSKPSRNAERATSSNVSTRLQTTPEQNGAEPLHTFRYNDNVNYNMLGGEMLAPNRAPPSTSPFTVPLQTIPSEAVLSVALADLNEEANDQWVQALSRLEGKGSPPKTDVDHQILLQMFGHLKRGHDKSNHNSTAFYQNAAAAEKFLAMRESNASCAKTSNLETAAGPSGDDTHGADRELDEMVPTAKKQTMISRWSNSTPSDKVSPPSQGLCPELQNSESSEATSQTRRRSSSKELVSIGYPSRIPGRMSTTDVGGTEDAATVAGIPSRRSSPTLSKRRPGSVRAAREGLQATTASFARTTASAESRKTAKPPTPGTRTFSIPEPAQRGRVVSAGKSRTRSDALTSIKTPRSRSKSRLMLDKINGLFSGKREKRVSIAPPIPRIEEGNVDLDAAKTSTKRSPTLKPARVTQLPKMPSLSPASQQALRSDSSATMHTDDTTLVDRISVQDESQCVQVLSEHLVGKARHETNPSRKARLLTFAKVLSDSLISVREAAISAETAQIAAQNARMHYEMSVKSLAMVQRLASSVARSGGPGRR
ncbi:hypothetical protein LTR37_013475 [Vermiconidia calcicola]|uniref:Uncharacterized protein n=1 Tax=Vermiconidia calcicola TaxID=1690605 RepID=A0ACC3MWF2_9PEZI|nr:hypothetical protein LTR37_013475 [Vermiconidia calcicola]